MWNVIDDKSGPNTTRLKRCFDYVMDRSWAQTALVFLLLGLLIVAWPILPFIGLGILILYLIKEHSAPSNPVWLPGMSTVAYEAAAKRFHVYLRKQQAKAVRLNEEHPDRYFKVEARDASIIEGPRRTE